MSDDDDDDDRVCILSTVAESPVHDHEKDRSLLERVQHRFTRMLPGFKKVALLENTEHLSITGMT